MPAANTAKRRAPQLSVTGDENGDDSAIVAMTVIAQQLGAESSASSRQSRVCPVT
jgi:hypothetical protein